MRAETAAGTVLVVAGWTTASIVEHARTAGTDRDAASEDPTAPESTAVGATPRRSRRPRSRSLPRRNRVRTVPTGHSRALRRLTFREALQLAQHDRLAVFFRELLDLVVKHVAEVVPSRVIRGWHRHLGRPPLVRTAPGRGRSGRQGDASGDAVQPARRRAPLANRSTLPSQDQERGLEGIFGVMRVAQDHPADAQHHWAMSGDQLGEGELARAAFAIHEPRQQLLVRQSSGRARVEERTDVSRVCAMLTHRHQIKPQQSEANDDGHPRMYRS